MELHIALLTKGTVQEIAHRRDPRCSHLGGLKHFDELDKQDSEWFDRSRHEKVDQQTSQQDQPTPAAIGRDPNDFLSFLDAWNKMRPSKIILVGIGTNFFF